MNLSEKKKLRRFSVHKIVPKVFYVWNLPQKNVSLIFGKQKSFAVSIMPFLDPLCIEHLSYALSVGPSVIFHLFIFYFAVKMTDLKINIETTSILLPVLYFAVVVVDFVIY